MYKPSNDKSKAQVSITETLRKEAEALEAERGADDPQTMAAVEKLALQLLDVYEDGEAEPYYQRVCDYSVKTLGAEHPETLARLARMAELLTDLDDREDEAGALLLKVLDARVKTLGEAHADTIKSLWDYADFLEFQDEDEQAEALYVRALENATKVFGADHKTTKSIAMELRILRDKGKEAPTDDDSETAESGTKKGCGPSTAALVMLGAAVYFLGRS